MLERQIVIGFIISTEVLSQVEPFWNPIYFESNEARMLAEWCMEYYKEYHQAPSDNIQGIYYEKLAGGMDETMAKDIEEILSGLSREFEKNPQKFNVDYLIRLTMHHFRKRRLLLHAETIRGQITRGEIEQAEKSAMGYGNTLDLSDTDLDLSDEKVLEKVERAFNIQSQSVLYYPGQFGIFVNEHLIRGGFIAFQSIEKRGKTFLLLDMGMRSCKQGFNVAFFQAGDMSESQLLRRVGIYLTKKSDKPKYIGEMWEPVRDCKFNQLNTCTNSGRECNFGVFEDLNEKELKEVTQEDLIQAYKDNPDYRPCWNCKKYENNRFGVPWVKRVVVPNVLKAPEAQKAIQNFFIKYGRTFKISTHPNGTLSVNGIRSKLEMWKRRDGFIPDLVLVDYADILMCEERVEFRHQNNKIWQGLRSLSQEYNCLVATATQSDADSYERNLMKMKNFSEDKRKYSHVTAMWGLNQDPNGREKQIGLMRLNELVLREGEFLNSNTVTILQNLKRGRPFLGSYFEF